MKFRVERDVLADAVAWAARSLPTRPPRPCPRRAADRGDDGDGCSRCRPSTTRPRRGRPDHADVQRAGGPGLRPAARRHLPQPARQAGRDQHRGRQGHADLRLGAVQPADDAGRGLPDPAADAGRDRHRPQRPFRPSGRPGAVAAGRDDMLPVLTGVRIEIEGDKITLLATDRFRLAQRELTWSPGAGHRRPPRWCRPRSSADTAKALTGGREVTIALGWPAGAGEGIIGFEGARRRRRTTTRLLDGEFPKVRTLFPTEHRPVARVDTGRPGRGGQAGRPGRRAQHRGPARVHRRAWSPSTPAAGDEAQAGGVAEPD